MVAEVARRNAPKRADGRQGAAFRPPQRVLAAAGVVDDLSFGSAWQVEVPHEHIARIEALGAIARVATMLESLTIPRIVFGVVGSGTGRTRTTTHGERVVVERITTGVVSTVAGIVTPARIVRHSSPPFSSAFSESSRQQLI